MCWEGKHRARDTFNCSRAGRASTASDVGLLDGVSTEESAATELWTQSENLYLRRIHSSSADGLEPLVWPKGLKHLVLYFFVKATMEVVWWPDTLMRLELLGGFDGSIVGVGWPSSTQTLEFGDAFDQNIGGDTLPASLQQLSFGFSFNQPVVGIGWPGSLRRLKFGYEL